VVEIRSCWVAAGWCCVVRAGLFLPGFFVALRANGFRVDFFFAISHLPNTPFPQYLPPIAQARNLRCHENNVLYRSHLLPAPELSGNRDLVGENESWSCTLSAIREAFEMSLANYYPTLMVSNASVTVVRIRNLCRFSLLQHDSRSDTATVYGNLQVPACCWRNDLICYFLLRRIWQTG
jgi:hypothetical protein